MHFVNFRAKKFIGKNVVMSCYKTVSCQNRKLFKNLKNFFTAKLIACYFSLFLWIPKAFPCQKKVKRFSFNFQSKVAKESQRNKRRVTRLVLVVIVVFCVSWAPIQFVLLLRAIGVYPFSEPSIIFQIFSQVLAYINR